ncbi:hypothetical protein BKA70DRAFT_1095374 [Coprinopsis sp. MPI-PUGE-AT-0042]|nr:hypothetical protein BKA70DRAFT_1095374 [Coprinopsis sp. MPI-PUGE-AT-0042]
MPPNFGTLKQRLAALSLSPSSPSNYDADGHKRRHFVPPWKRNVSEPGYGAHEALEDVLSKMIFQAGVDYEVERGCRVVLNSSALPDPQVVSYDLLLSRILGYLNLYVEADYTVVFFAAGNQYTPGWNWIWKAYRSLSRKYRKNLKQLYIVHSSFFSKMLFSLAGAIISPKFFRKIVYISTLSELAHYVPITQIDIPPAVYQENLKYERKITLPVPVRSSTFGVPLEDLMGFNGEKGGIPRVVKDCIQYIRETGMSEEGLFRRSPSSAMLRAAQDAYDRGNVVSLSNFGDPNLAAVLLKKYMRDLPEPLFPEQFYPLIRQCPPPTSDPADMSAINYLRDTLLPALPPCSCILLSHILQLLHEVSLRSATNRMDEFNLAIVICPNLVKSSNPARDVAICAVAGVASMSGPAASSAFPSRSTAEGKTTLGSIIALCIRRYYEIFDEFPDLDAVRYPVGTPQTLYTPSYNDSPGADLPPSPYVIHDDDEDFEDDEMGDVPGDVQTASGNTTAKRHRSTPSGASNNNATVNAARGDVASAHYGSGALNSSGPYSTHGRAKSLINIEKGSGLPGHKKGSISVGRGTMKKGSGAAVEALGVTASGFFTPPQDAPPVPMSPTAQKRASRDRSRPVGDA